MRPPLPFTKPAMPKTCSTCIHWKAMPAGARSDGLAGECREGSPVADWKWPRTRCTDYCSRYSNTAQAEPASERAPEPKATAPAAPQQLSLDATPESGAAPLTAEGVGKTSTASRGSGNRPRRDSARTAESSGQASTAGVE